jgi:hypothetical protein
MNLCKQTYYNNGSYLRARSNEKAICDLIKEIENGTIIPSIVSNGGTIYNNLTIRGNLSILGTIYYENVSFNTLEVSSIKTSNITLCNQYHITCNNNGINIDTSLNSTTISSNNMYVDTILPTTTDITVGSSSGNININSPLTIQYTTPLTNINQLGYNYYSLTQRLSTLDVSNSTGFVFSPQSGDSTPPILLPAGVYRIDLNISVVADSLHVTTITWNAGYCYSTSLPMTSGNTTRTTLIGSGGVLDTSYTSGTTKLEYFSCGGVFTVSSGDANTRYYAGYGSIALGTITSGSADCKIISCFITRIA